MCPYQVGCNLIFNRYILKVPFSECSFIIPSEYFLSIVTRLHLSHLTPIFRSATTESSPHTKYSIINLLHFLHLISITFPLFNSVHSLFIQNHQFHNSVLVKEREITFARLAGSSDECMHIPRLC